MASLSTTIAQFVRFYLQVKSEHPTKHTELEFRIGKVNANNGFDAGYVVPELKPDDTLIDPEKTEREKEAFSRLREALERHTTANPTRWTMKMHPPTFRSFHANNVRQSFTPDSQDHIIECKTSIKHMLIRSNGMLQIRAAISLEERFKFAPTSQEAIALKQKKPIAVCVLERKSFTEVIPNETWGNITFRYDLTKVTPKKPTKDKCCTIHAQYHGELELVEYPDMTKSSDHMSYMVEMILLRLRFLLGNCIIDPENPAIQTPLPPPVLYCDSSSI